MSDENKANAQAFYDLMFNECRPREAIERYAGQDPVNIGTGHEITIPELAAQIAAAVGFEGRITYDASKPDAVAKYAIAVAIMRVRCQDTVLGFRLCRPEQATRGSGTGTALPELRVACSGLLQDRSFDRNQ